MNACALFLPLIFFFEGEELVGAMDSQFVNSVFWGAMVIAGFFGFSIGIVTVLQIKATSPLSHNISGTAKAAVQSLMAFYLWGVSPFIHPFFYFSKIVCFDSFNLRTLFSSFPDTFSFSCRTSPQSLVCWESSLY